MLPKLLLIAAAAALAAGCPDETNCMECRVDPATKQGGCALCFHGFVTAERKCQLKIQAPIHHCLFYELKEQDGLRFPVCKTCELGFYLEGDKCKRCESEKCAVCDRRGDCVACFDGRVPDFSKVHECSDKACPLRNCEVCSYEDHQHAEQPTCLRCRAGAVMLRGNPYECLSSRIANCALIDSVEAEKCAVCRDGFFLSRDFECVANAAEKPSNAWILYLVGLVLLAAVGAFLYERTLGSARPKDEALIEA